MFMHHKPDYSTYTLEELKSVLKHVDRERYEDRYQEVLSILKDKNRYAELKEQQEEIEEQQKTEKAESNKIFGVFFPIVFGLRILFFGIGLSSRG